MPSVALAPSFNLSFQNEMVIYEQNVICHVKDNEFNLSYNPTLLQDNLFSGSGFFSQSLTSPIPEVKYFVTASYFEPYVTTVGLYNEQNDLLAVAKLAQPIPLSQNTDMTFVVKYDK
jgi:hypothetical protein